MFKWKYLSLLTIAVIFFNEYLISYMTIRIWCKWPTSSRNINQSNLPSRIAIIADVHVLGDVHGHWFDKLRREWNMYRNFQSFIALLSPEAVFFLGDQLDEGQISDRRKFAKYADRFKSIFSVPKNIKRFMVAGNHDIGFHYAITPSRLRQYEFHFGLGLVEHITIGRNHIVAINSMVMERDGCSLCFEAQWQLNKLHHRFDCAANAWKNCSSNFTIPYSRPILVQHFPLYRRNDADCEDEPDSAGEPLKSKPFRENWDCLSRDSTERILAMLNPRAVFDGHMHFACRTWWPEPHSFWEMTLPSFSWRNTPQPSLLLLAAAPDELNVSKCFLPNEFTIIGIYLIHSFLTVLYVLYRVLPMRLMRLFITRPGSSYVVDLPNMYIKRAE